MWKFLPIYLEALGGVSDLDSLSAERPEKLENIPEYSMKIIILIKGQ